MAKKAKVKPRNLMQTIESTKQGYNPSLTADMTTKYAPGISAHSQFKDGSDMIGANLGQLSHQMDSVEQAQQVDKLRKQAKARMATKSTAAAAASKASAAVAPAKPKRDLSHYISKPEFDLNDHAELADAYGDGANDAISEINKARKGGKKKVAKVTKK